MRLTRATGKRATLLLYYVPELVTYFGGVSAISELVIDSAANESYIECGPHGRWKGMTGAWSYANPGTSQRHH